MYMYITNYKCKKLNNLKHLVRTTVAGSHNKNSKYQKRRYYLAAHRRVVNVLTSNSAFFDICCFCCVIQPQSSLQDVLNC